MRDDQAILEQAKTVLNGNDRGLYTIPAHGLYPHQWFWDSCFIAIGLRHLDVERAKMEILSVLRGQWSNGMIPHMLFNSDKAYARDRSIWRSWISPFAPEDVVTSGITQPPMLAEAIVRIGQKLPVTERRSWYRQVFKPLLQHHLWLYSERDPHGEGLALQVHPWETGLDDTPPWMSELHSHLLPWWIRGLQKTKLDAIFGYFRRDTRIIPKEQRFSNVDALALYDTQRRLRRKAYNIDKILDHALFAIEDMTFNAIFVRANDHLLDIARSIREPLPPELLKRIEKTRKTLEELWDPYTEQYYSRDFVTHRLIKVPSIATLMPLYAGTASKERAALLVKSLENEHIFGATFPVPSVPLNSAWFKQQRFWQGPTWFNTNWLIIDGLRRYGYHEHAEALTEASLELVRNGSFNEYFNPVNGEPLGAQNFSWTAALTIDWVASRKKKH
ncbi:MAG TPA: trehalase family glycosidase [Candidatus Saccharimonadales bacterium]|nr:trehalase family glycosidase [Candidatus Saccharimonadales bacterium]